MGIGTSLGAYFESDFHHEAGIVTSKETGDNNVITPDQLDQNQQMDKIEMNEMGIPVSYDTQLADSEHSAFQDWKAKNAPNDNGQDYDLQGAFKAGLTASENGHLRDDFKKPNHPTFSDESVYHGRDGEEGGHWGTEDGKDTFTPGPTNLKNHGVLGLIKYFDEHEPDAKLLMPKAK